MNIWIIAAMIVGLLLVAGTINVAIAKQEVETEVVKCENCDNLCSAERNCGRSTCEAIVGGSCGCGG